MPFCAFCQDEEAEHTDKTCPDLKCKICGANGHIFRHCPQKNQAYVLSTPVEVPKFTAATTSERKASGKISIDLQDGFSRPLTPATLKKESQGIKIEFKNLLSMPGPSVLKNEKYECEHKSFVPNKCKFCNLPHNIENCWRKINNLLNKTKRLQKVKQDARKLSKDREQSKNEIMIIGLVSKNNGPIINSEF